MKFNNYIIVYLVVYEIIKVLINHKYIVYIRLSGLKIKLELLVLILFESVGFITTIFFLCSQIIWWYFFFIILFRYKIYLVVILIVLCSFIHTRYIQRVENIHSAEKSILYIKNAIILDSIISIIILIFVWCKI